MYYNDIYSSGFCDTFGAKYRNLRSNKYNLQDDVIFTYDGYTRQGIITQIDVDFFSVTYKIMECGGKVYRVDESDIKRRKDMAQIKVNFDCGVDSVISEYQTFDIGKPKFKVGDKVKFQIGSQNKIGVIYTAGKQVNVSISEKDNGRYKTDKIPWGYVIIESGTLKTYNGVREENVKIDDTPDYNKYFDFLDKQGVKLDRTRYTWKTFTQETFISGGRIEDMSNGIYGFSVGWKADKAETSYSATLCDKSTNGVVSFKGKQVGADKLPTISEKC